MLRKISWCKVNIFHKKQEPYEVKLEVVDEINDINLEENYVDETYYEDQKIEAKPELNSQIKKRKHKSRQEPNWYCKVCKLIGKKIDSTILRAYLNPTKVSNTCQICNKKFRKELTSHEGKKIILILILENIFTIATLECLIFIFDLKFLKFQ